MKPTLTQADVTDLVERIEKARAEHDTYYPGAPSVRQPVHTVYVPADHVHADICAKYGERARQLLDEHAPTGVAFDRAMGFDDVELSAVVRDRVADKLLREPIEDVRIDFEDAYGDRDDAEEDRDVARAVDAISEARRRGLLPPFFGLRVKSYADGEHERSIRTLDLFLSSLLERCGGRLPEGFVITFPKIVMPDHVAAFAELLSRLEDDLGLPEGVLRFEIQIETTESIVNHRGEVGLRALLEAAGTRLSGAHFGVYDFTASCGLGPEDQRLTHPVCDFARGVMQVVFAGTGVLLSDGSTNVVPAGAGTAALHSAWRTHAAHVEHSLRHGYYQGWDRHPAQLPSRFAAVYAFHLRQLEEITQRVRSWFRRGDGREGVLDEASTVEAMLNQLRRAVDCGAVSGEEVLTRTGLRSL